MQIIRLIKKQEDGSYEATLALSQEQTEFLLNVALGVLVRSGLATINDQLLDPEEVDVTPAPETPIAETIN